MKSVKIKCHECLDYYNYSHFSNNHSSTYPEDMYIYKHESHARIQDVLHPEIFIFINSDGKILDYSKIWFKRNNDFFYLDNAKSLNKTTLFKLDMLNYICEDLTENYSIEMAYCDLVKLTNPETFHEEINSLFKKLYKLSVLI